MTRRRKSLDLTKIRSTKRHDVKRKKRASVGAVKSEECVELISHKVKAMPGTSTPSKKGSSVSDWDIKDSLSEKVKHAFRRKKGMWVPNVSDQASQEPVRELANSAKKRKRKSLDPGDESPAVVVKRRKSDPGQSMNETTKKKPHLGKKKAKIANKENAQKKKENELFFGIGTQERDATFATHPKTKTDQAVPKKPIPDSGVQRQKEEELFGIARGIPEKKRSSFSDLKHLQAVLRSAETTQRNRRQRRMQYSGDTGHAREVKQSVSCPKMTQSKQSKKSESSRKSADVSAKKAKRNISTTTSSSSEDSVDTSIDTNDSPQNRKVLSGTRKKRSHTPEKPLMEKMKDKLKGAHFRYINEQLYTQSGQDSEKFFEEDKDAFTVYHEGFQSQVSKWPTNPVNKMIEYIKSKPKKFVVADFGCGDAKLAASVKQKCHNFDLVALNDRVTVCNIANLPLEDESIDIGVFCLSLMGTDLVDYLVEANRVIKHGGILLVAEVVSRFEKVGAFIRKMGKLGFNIQQKDLSNKMFVWLEFAKTGTPNMDRLPEIELAPCLYKKR